MHNETLAKKATAAIGEEIGYELGTQFISDFRNANPNETLSYIVGKDIISQILAQPGCEGIRFYNALNEAGKKTLVYVGVDKEGNNLFQISMVNETGKITNEDAVVADRSDDGGDSWWKWIFGL